MSLWSINIVIAIIIEAQKIIQYVVKLAVSIYMNGESITNSLFVIR